MGCAHANFQPQQPQPEPVSRNLHPNIGLLTIKILNLNFALNHSVLRQSSYDQIKFQLQNQSFVSFLHHNFGHKSNVTVEPSAFHLSINTFEKRRQLQVELFSNQELRCSKRLAVSHLDLSSLIQGRQNAKISTENSLFQSQKTINIKLENLQGNQVSQLFLLIKFVPQPFEFLTIKVNSITLRNYSLKKRKIYIRIQVGQEIFESTSAIEDKSQIPTWSDAFHTFIIPVSLNQGKISVFEKKKQRGNNLLGQLRLNLKMMLKNKKLQSYCEELKLQSQIAGTVKLQTLKSISPNDVTKIKIDQPTKIAVQKLEQNPVQGRDDLKIQINSIDSFHKTIENEPTTNFGSSRSRDFSSGIMGRDGKSTSKSSNIYRRNLMVLPPIQSAPLSARQRDYRSWLQQNIKEEKMIKDFKQKKKSIKAKNLQEQKKQFSFENDDVISKGKLDILRIQSHLEQNFPSKPVQSEEDQQGKLIMGLFDEKIVNQESAQLPPLNNFFIKLTQDIETIDFHKAEQKNQKNDRKSNRQTKSIRSFSRNSTRKINQQIIQLNQKFITIDKDLESRPLTPYTTQKDSKPFITVESGFVEFDLSLKDESNQSQNNQNNNKITTLEMFDTNYHQSKPNQKQNSNQKEAQNMKAIKQLGKLSDDEFFANQKSNVFEFPNWEQEKYTNPQIQPQL